MAELATIHHLPEALGQVDEVAHLAAGGRQHGQLTCLGVGGGMSEEQLHFPISSGRLRSRKNKLVSPYTKFWTVFHYANLELGEYLVFDVAR